MGKSISSWKNFFIGLLTGFIGGGCVVWLEMKDENRNFLSQILFELNTLKLEKKILDDNHQKEKNGTEKNPKLASKSTKSVKSEGIPEGNLSIDSAKIGSLKNDSLTLAFPQINIDSLKSDSLSNPSELMVIRKDRFISSKTLKLMVKGEEEKISGENDSLLDKISGVHKEEDKGEFIVEFWESPINYKGYKMGNKKIILFGLGEEFEKIGLFQFNKKIFLRFNDSMYELETTYTFQPLNRVTDKNLFSKTEIF